jgi:hypothetical protein
MYLPTGVRTPLMITAFSNGFSFPYPLSMSAAVLHGTVQRFLKMQVENHFTVNALIS